ncbi:hypothetical protein [Alteromonas profundi]|nr:hypothetical protein [Alteromonas profundi]
MIMMVTFSVIGFLILIVGYMALRMQNMQKEITLSRSSAKQNNSKASHAYRTLVMVTEALGKNLATRIDNAFKRHLITQQQHLVLMLLMSNFSNIVMQCSEKSATVEEALSRILKTETLSFVDIQDVIKEMPSNIRVAWSKNTAEGFIAACQLITVFVTGDAAKKTSQTESQAS